MILYRFLLWQSVSTHSRPKAAGVIKCRLRFYIVSFNTQPPEGGWHTHLFRCVLFAEFQHTAARRRLVFTEDKSAAKAGEFQHTAARRRLVPMLRSSPKPYQVSTHSRPKAAGKPLNKAQGGLSSFNTQPPEGGWKQQTIHK